MTPADYDEISHLMTRYFDGLYQADSHLLRSVFHPKLSYVCATEGDELHLDLETYLARVDRRDPPARRGEVRSDEVLEIAIGSARTARVTARMSMMGRRYLDYLTLVRDSGAWRIVTKVFTYEAKENQTCPM